MRRSMARTGVFALSLALLLLGGCEYKKFAIVIPNLVEDEIQGVQMYRLDADSGAFLPAGAIELSAPKLEGGELVVSYQMINPDGSRGIELEAPVEEVAAEGTRITLWFARWDEPGAFRASLWNAAGEGSLSDGSIAL